jgi:NAD(P)H-dependent FMN reductase
LLVVHHTTSPTLAEMLDAVLSGARDPAITDLELSVLPALSANSGDVLAADGYLLGTPANIGYMSGALKHFFDQIYYPCLLATAGRPYGCYVHGNNDTAGAVRAIESIAAGLSWRIAAAPLAVTGPAQPAREACRELGAVVAATVAGLA